MYKNDETGYYEHDFRVTGVPRYHLSYGVSRKAAALRLHSTAVALFKSRELAVIAAVRRGDVSIEQLTQLRETGRPFAAALDIARVVDAWPLWSDAATLYTEGLATNTTRAPRTAVLAAQELKRFAVYLAEIGAAEIRLDELTSTLVEGYQASLIAAGCRPNTVSAYVSRVGSLFHWFIRRETRSAREAKRLPRVLHVPLDPETISRTKTARVRFLSESEANRLIAATPRPLLFPVAAGLFGGFRVDEMCHFRTEHDVDLAVGVLSVQRQPSWRPKTRRSIRHVPIADVLRPILVRHAERFASADWVMPSFRDPTKPLNSRLFAKHFARIVDDADLISGNTDPEGVTYHTLRHTFASWSLMAGTDVFTVAKLLGNTVKQVEDTYGHLALDFRKAAVDRLGSTVVLPTLLDESEGRE